jgi:hypothetical protein
MKIWLSILRADGVTPTGHTYDIEEHVRTFLPSVGDEVHIDGMADPVVVARKRFCYRADGSLEIEIIPRYY